MINMKCNISLARAKNPVKTVSPVKLGVRSNRMSELSKPMTERADEQMGQQRTVARMTMKSTRRVLGHSLAPLTHSLAPHCSLRSRAPLRSFVPSHRSLTHSGAHGKETYELNLRIESVDFMVFRPTVDCAHARISI